MKKFSLPMTRPPIDRMRLIINHIRDSHYPSREVLAKKIEVSKKTIQRDITHMKDRMNVPIEYDRTKGGYWLTRPITDFPMIQVSEGEIVSLLVAQKALAQHHGTPFEQPLRAAFDKIIQGLPREFCISWQGLESAISFRSIDSNPVELEVFNGVSHAVQSRTEMRFEYKKVNSANYEKRHARPYHLACINNQWYAITFDVNRGEIRTFVLSRMRALKQSNIKFKIPKDFSIDK